MLTRPRVAALLFILLIFIQPIAAQVRPALQSFPELTPLPLSEQLSTTREPLSVETLIDASLQFSGASDDVSTADKDKLGSLMKRFRDEVDSVTGQDQLAERALTFLHRNLLTTYSTRQTRVDTALETGVFNCVSSAVLYMILARSVGLSVDGVRTVDHAFCSVMVNGEPVDVETTNPFGYNPGSKKEFTDSFGKVTGFSYVPPSSYGDRRSIGEKELLTLILYNRVSEYSDGRYFRDAVSPAVSAYALMGNDEFRGVMTTALSNYISWMGTRRDFPRAIQFIDAVKASFGGTVDLEARGHEVYHNWVVSLIDGGSLSGAEALLSQPAARTALGDDDWTGLSIAVIQARAEQETRTAGFLPAAQVITEGIRKLGAQPLLLQTYEAYMHNAFAQLYNARKLADARTVIDQGLSAYPDSRILGQDRDLLRRTPRP